MKHQYYHFNREYFFDNMISAFNKQMQANNDLIDILEKAIYVIAKFDKKVFNARVISALKEAIPDIWVSSKDNCNHEIFELEISPSGHYQKYRLEPSTHHDYQVWATAYIKLKRCSVDSELNNPLSRINFNPADPEEDIYKTVEHLRKGNKKIEQELKDIEKTIDEYDRLKDAIQEFRKHNYIVTHYMDL